MKALLYILLCMLSLRMQAAPHIRFTQNKGQWNDSVLFKADIGHGTVFLKKQSFTFVFYSDEWIQAIGHNRIHQLHHEHESIKHNHSHHSLSNEYTHHAYTVMFEGANPKLEVVGESSLNYYENYYIGNNPSQWVSNATVYAKVRYKNIYQGIDLVVYQNEDGFKYDFELSPHANYTQIMLKFIGVNTVGVNEQKGLDIITAVNHVTEKRPYAYRLHNGRQRSVDCGFELKEKNKVGFTLGKYNENDTLVIDPELIFSTYSGSTADNWGFTATYDQNGDVYSGGVVFGQSYPFTLGPYQQTFNGGETDVAIYKVNRTGDTLRYATFLGGASSEMPQSMIVNSKNELVLYGTTGSPDFPIAQLAYSSAFKGGSKLTYDGGGFVFDQGTDIYVVKFSEDGRRLTGGTFYGGSDNDGINYRKHLEDSLMSTMNGNDSLYYNYGDGARGEITVDYLDNIYIGTCTFSSDCPVVSGFQANLAGREDGLVLKFNSGLTNLLWSSYVGGTEDDAVFSIDVDKQLNIYFAGGTSSKDIPVTSGAYKVQYQGGTTDAFVGKMNGGSAKLIGLSYFGSDSYDQAYFVRVNKRNEPHIYGQTKAAASTLIFNAKYNTPNSGQFLAKFSTDLTTLTWSTVFGNGSGRPNISPTAFSVDMCHRIYLAGAGRDWPYGYFAGRLYYDWSFVHGTTGLEITKDAYQKVTDGQDFYFLVLNENAESIDYATFLGELHGAGNNNCFSNDYYAGTDHVDGGTARFDKHGNIYQAVCASCRGCQGFPIKPKPGAVSTSNNSNNCNNAVLRFQIHFDQLEALFANPDVLCDPLAKYFQNKSSVLDTTIVKFTWNFGDGSPISHIKSPVHHYSKEGTYTVCLIAEDLTSCNLVDTLCKEIIVTKESSHTILPEIAICIGDTVRIGLDRTDTLIEHYKWTPNIALSNDTIPNPMAWPSKTTHYTIEITNKLGCTRIVEQTVDVSNFKDKAYELTYTIEPDNVCENLPTTIRLHTNALTRAYIISNDSLFKVNLLRTSHDSVLTLTVTKDTVLYVKVFSQRCQQFDTAVIRLHPITLVSISDSAKYLSCVGKVIDIQASAVGVSANTKYNWMPESLLVKGQGTLTASVKISKKTTFSITATNTITGCKSSDSIEVDIDTPRIKLQVIPPSCNASSDGKILATASGIPPFTYRWNDLSSKDSLINLSNGRYFVTLTDSLGCSDTLSAQVKNPDKMSLNSVAKPSCDNQCSGSVQLKPSGGTPPYMYEWDLGSKASKVINLCPGTYAVTVTDFKGCQQSETFTIVSDIHVVAQGSDSICVHSVITARASVSPDLKTNSFAWSPTIDIVQGQTTNEMIAKPQESRYYVVEVINSATGCKTRDSVYVFVDNPTINSITKQISCFGKNDASVYIPHSGVKPFRWQWSDGSVDSVRNMLSPGAYSVQLIDSMKCNASTTVLITQPDSLHIQLSLQNRTCAGYCNGKALAQVAGGTKPYNYSWVNSIDSVTRNLCAGTYTLSVLDANNCIATKQFTINYQEHTPQLKPEIKPPYIYVGQQATLYALPKPETNVQYEWYPIFGLETPHSATTKFAGDSTQFFWVSATDVFGCTVYDTLRVQVRSFICDHPFVFVPNTFTPNSDGKNDVLQVKSNILSSLDFKIFDRWGELIFETNDIAKAWDGSYKNHAVTAGVYVYHLTAVCINGEKIEKKGDISVIR